MNIPWNDVQLIIAVYEAGSISAAARQLQITQPTVSRRLAELEASLGEALFVRAVDGTTPTPYGERLLEPALRMADCAADIAHAAASAERSPRGVVRISVAPGIASIFLIPFAVYLAQELPEIRLEVVSTTRYVDLVRHEADLAIRWQSTSRPSRQRDLEVLATIEHRIAAFANVDYLASRARRPGVADLDWIGWCAPFEELAPNPQLAARIEGFRPMLGSDDFLVQLRAAELGLGAIVLPCIHYRDGMPSSLVETRIDLGVPPARTHLVAARSSLAVPRIAAVAEHLAKQLETTNQPKPPRRRRATRAT